MPNPKETDQLNYFLLFPNSFCNRIWSNMVRITIWPCQGKSLVAKSYILIKHYLFSRVHTKKRYYLAFHWVVLIQIAKKFWWWFFLIVEWNIFSILVWSVQSGMIRQMYVLFYQKKFVFANCFKNYNQFSIKGLFLKEALLWLCMVASYKQYDNINV